MRGATTSLLSWDKFLCWFFWGKRGTRSDIPFVVVFSAPKEMFHLIIQAYAIGTPFFRGWGFFFPLFCKKKKLTYFPEDTEEEYQTSIPKKTLKKPNPVLLPSEADYYYFVATY